MKKKNSSTLKNSDPPALTRHKTYRMDATIAHELDVYCTVRRINPEGLSSERAIVETALSEWFKRNPIARNLRDAAELLVSHQRGKE